MSEITESSFCGIDGCGSETGASRTSAPTGRSVNGSGPKITIEVFSDAICPWCFVAKRYLDRAVVELGKKFDVAVRWLPFELNPDMPKEGLDRKKYRSAKFGSWANSQDLDAHVAEAGRRAGAEFNHERIGRTPNTFDAHRLIWFADREGVQDAVVEGLFSGYFTEGRDVGDRKVLVEIAAGAGLDREKVAKFLDSDEGADDVLALAARAYSKGLTGVPCIVANGTVLFCGARSTEDIVAAVLATTQLGRSPAAVSGAGSRKR